MLRIRRGDRRRRKYKQIIAEHVPGEPVLAVGMFSRGGSWGSLGAVAGGGLAGELAIRGSKKRAGGLPPNVALAVTPTKVHVFDYRPKGFGIKVKKKVAEWDRPAIRVDTGEGMVTNQLRLELTDGRRSSSRTSSSAAVASSTRRPCA